MWATQLTLCIGTLVKATRELVTVPTLQFNKGTIYAKKPFSVKEGQGWEWAGSNSKLVFRSAGVGRVFQRSLSFSQQAGQVQPPRASRESWLLFQILLQHDRFHYKQSPAKLPVSQAFLFCSLWREGLGSDTCVWASC